MKVWELLGLTALLQHIRVYGQDDNLVYDGTNEDVPTHVETLDVYAIYVDADCALHIETI